MLSSLSYKSAALGHNTEVCVILPDNAPAADVPVLYLLHGMSGCHESWLRKSRIESYAAERRVAVVMPDGENSFYLDMKYGKKFFTFVACELPETVRRVYGLSGDREKNFIAGLSMGGYGAVRTALMRPESFCAAASLSGCLDIVRILRDGGLETVAPAIWGEDWRTCAAGTDSDIFRLLDNFSASSPKPALYAACGEQDFLFADNSRFRDYMLTKGKEAGFRFEWEQKPGIHDWNFWDATIGNAMDFCLSAGSGN